MLSGVARWGQLSLVPIFLADKELLLWCHTSRCNTTQHDATRRNPVAEETCEKVAGQKVQDHTSIYKPIAGSLQDNTSQLQIIASPLIAPGSCQMLCNCRWTCGACGGGALLGISSSAILDAGNLKTAWSADILKQLLNFVEFCWDAQVMWPGISLSWWIHHDYTMTHYISLRYPQVTGASSAGATGATGSPCDCGPLGFGDVGDVSSSSLLRELAPMASCQAAPCCP